MVEVEFIEIYEIEFIVWKGLDRVVCELSVKVVIMTAIAKEEDTTRERGGV